MDEQAVAWLRRQIEVRRGLARRAVELGNLAVWTEPSSGVLITSEPTEDDIWRGTQPMGDSSLTRLMEANDPQDTFARCEAELAIVAVCLPVKQRSGPWRTASSRPRSTQAPRRLAG